MVDLYCVIGKPINHSLSPYLHNLSFKKHNISAVYSAFEVKDIEKFVSCVRILPIKGISVTIPYKEEIIKYVDVIGETEREIGAINTIVNKDGILMGYNTDGIGAINSLKEVISIRNKNVLILGYGGSAKAISYMLLKEGIGKLFISGRSREKAEKLISYIRSKVAYMDIIFISIFSSKKLREQIENVDIIVNTTPIGMNPNSGISPLFDDCFLRDKVYMDIVYNPVDTLFLKKARVSGGIPISGEKMFVYQAIEQEKIWFGIKPDVVYLMDKVRERLFNG